MRYICDCKYVSDYKLLLSFENRKVKLVDLAQHLEGDIFKPLKDKDYFKTVLLNRELDTIVWDNGADFSPEFLYDIGIDYDQQVHKEKLPS